LTLVRSVLFLKSAARDGRFWNPAKQAIASAKDRTNAAITDDRNQSRTIAKTSHPC
jgi:hypothetical protein